MLFPAGLIVTKIRTDYSDNIYFVTRIIIPHSSSISGVLTIVLQKIHKPTEPTSDNEKQILHENSMPPWTNRV